jgi:hypothetical protein
MEKNHIPFFGITTYLCTPSRLTGPELVVGLVLMDWKAHSAP